MEALFASRDLAIFIDIVIWFLKMYTIPNHRNNLEVVKNPVYKIVLCYLGLD